LQHPFDRVERSAHDRDRIGRDMIALELLRRTFDQLGAIFRIARGQGSAYRQELVAKGAHASPVPEAEKPATQEVKNESK